MLDLAALVSGSLGAAVVSGIVMLVQAVVNKKLRTPSDTLAAEQAAVSERNDLLERYKSDLIRVQGDLRETEDRMDIIEGQLRELRTAFVGWAYRAVVTIRRLGSEDDIPQPLPPDIEFLARTAPHPPPPPEGSR